MTALFAVDPSDHLADLTPYGLTVDGHPVVAMTRGIASSMHTTLPCNSRPVRGICEVCVGRLAQLLTAARDTAEPGEPVACLYEVPLTVTSPGGVSDEVIWIKQNHPYDQYVILCPCEY